MSISLQFAISVPSLKLKMEPEARGYLVAQQTQHRAALDHDPAGCEQAVEGSAGRLWDVAPSLELEALGHSRAGGKHHRVFTADDLSRARPAAGLDSPAAADDDPCTGS